MENFGKIILLIVATLCVPGISILQGQCTGGIRAGTGVPTMVAQTQILSDMQPEYFEARVTNGTTYRFSLCPAEGGLGRGNSRLTLLDSMGVFIVENIDAGGACGNDAEITYTATYTGIVRVLASRNNCNTGNNSNGHRLAYRILPAGSVCTANPHSAPACAAVPTAHDIDIGNSTAAVFFRENSNSRLQSIYLASELASIGLGANDQIQGIRFKFNGNVNVCFEDLTLMMGHTTKTSFINSGDYVSGLTMVASPFDYQILTTGFGSNAIMYFDTPFTWNGTDNLILEATISCSSTQTTDFRATSTAATRTLATFDIGSCNANTQQRQYNFIPNMEFTVCGSVLPTAVVDFDVFESEENVEIAWSTQGNFRDNIFAVFRSKDMYNWEKVASPPKVRQAGEVMLHHLIDTDPYRGLSFYQLTQTNLNGETIFSGTRQVEIAGLVVTHVYPVPSRGHFCFDVFSENNDVIQVKITDSYGKGIYEQEYYIATGTNGISMNLTGQASGRYSIIITAVKQRLRAKREVVLY